MKPAARNAMLVTVMALLFTLGCSPLTEQRPKGPAAREQPLSTGKLVSIELLDKPYPQYSPHQFSVEKHTDGNVEIYANFIIITSPNGVSVLSPHGWYKNLIYKKK